MSVVIDTIRTLTRRIENVVMRGVVSSYDLDGGMRVVNVNSIMNGESNNIELMTPAGIAARPAPSPLTDVLLLSLNGDRSGQVCIALPGRKADQVHPDDDNDVVIHALGDTRTRITIKENGDIILAASKVTVQGDLDVTGTLTVPRNGTPTEVAAKGDVTSNGGVIQ